MQARIELKGTSPLLMHNIRLADPDDRFTRAIQEITSKRRKTEEDRREIEKLEWFGGLYVADGVGVAMPTGNIRKCLIEAAKITRQGKQVSRALAFTDLFAPVAYDGPRDLDELRTTAGFQHRASVGVGTKRVIRVRPQFASWAIVADAYVLTEVMDVDDLRRIVRLAGLSEGLGDNRGNGYGRFEGSVIA